MISTRSSECQPAQTNGKNHSDPLRGSQMMSPRLTTIHHSTTDMQHPTKPATSTTTTTHHNTPSTLFLPTHFIPSGATLVQEYLDKCFLRDARNGPQPTHSGTHGKSGPCVQREPTGRVIIVIVAERGEREDKSGKREEKENDGREKERRDIVVEKRKKDEKR